MNMLVRVFVLPLLVLGAVVATYWNHFENGYHFDDSHTIVNNVYIRDLSNIPKFFTDGTTFSSLPTNQSYRPLVSTTLAIDYWLAGELRNVKYFHLSTFIFFLLQGLLMFFVLYKLFRFAANEKTSYWIALIASAWYLLHPANAETINYIIARSDSLSTFFVLLAFVMYMYSPFCRKWFLYLIPVGIGALAKPPAVMFAPLLFLYICFFEKRSGIGALFKKEGGAEFLPVLKATWPAFVFCIFMFLFTRMMEPATWIAGSDSPFNYLITQPYVIIHYFVSFFLPLHLSADSDWTPLDSIMNIRAILGFLFVIFLIVVAWVSSNKEKGRPIAFGILWFFIALAPTSLVPLAEVLNDHRVFFPYIGLAISACWGTWLLLEKASKDLSKTVVNASLAAVTVLALSAYAWGTVVRNEVWRSEESLWFDVTKKSPKNARGLMNYGLVLMLRADYTGAEKYFTEALALWPRYSYIHINLGVLKEATAHPEEAESYFKNGVAFGAVYPEPYYYYGRFLYNTKRFEESLPLVKKALELSPAHLNARHLLMNIYFDLGEFEQLKQLAEETQRLNPGDERAIYYLEAAKNGKSRLDQAIIKAGNEPTPENYLDLSLRFYEAGEYENSIRAAEDAVKLKPDYDPAYNNICSAYNMLGQWDKAIEAGKKAVQFNPSNQLAKNNLAWAEQKKAEQKQKP